MPIFSSDTFVDIAGVDLTAHAMSGGGTWTRNTVRSTIAAVITNENRARHAGSAFTISLYYQSEVPSSANYYVQADFHSKSNINDSLSGICARLSTTLDTFYYVSNYFNAGAGAWSLNKRVGGVETGLGTNFSQTLSAGTSYTVRLEAHGSYLTVRIDGVTRITAYDAAITDTNRAGLTCYSATTPNNTTGLHLDNFSASTDVFAPAAIGFIGDSQYTNYLTSNIIPTLMGPLVEARINRWAHFVNEGVASSHTGTGALGWAPGAASNFLTDAKTEFAARGVTHVNIMLGTNDCGDGIALSAANYRINMDAICDDLVAAGYKVVLHYPPWFNIVDSADEGLGASALALIESYMPMIDSLVDHTTVFQGDTQGFDYLEANPGEMHTDGYHLANTGKVSIATFQAAAALGVLREFFLIRP